MLVFDCAPPHLNLRYGDGQPFSPPKRIFSDVIEPNKDGKLPELFDQSSDLNAISGSSIVRDVFSEKRFFFSERHQMLVSGKWQIMLRIDITASEFIRMGRIR
ncbi:hypothetical protein V2A85_11640 [Yersinia sp. 1252 StPb PI]|uniref:hypothetical protein n=1 Tax=Yersinia sp. 1252 StPb PI TaxID=3117404 RepID=UPI003B28204D